MLPNGSMVKGCHFKLYERAIYSGVGHLLKYTPESIRCFIKDEEVLNIDFIGASIEKIYNEETEVDLTRELLEKHQEVQNLLGYKKFFPLYREVVRLR
jgi:hypothetical protein